MNDSCLELKKQYGEIQSNLSALLSEKARIGNTGLSAELTTSLRKCYLEAGRICQKLSEMVGDKNMASAYAADARRALELAKGYGSFIQTKKPKTTFSDVAGLEEVKEKVKDFIFIANNQSITQHYNLTGGFGLLLVGAPGCGKSLICEAISCEMNLPLFTISPSDIFNSYVGESEKAVKQVFADLDACSDGSIVLIDEADAIFSRRGAETKDYKMAIAAELLQRMNGFGTDNSKQVMVAATNRPYDIDPAYLRFKRFSHKIYIPLPSAPAIEAIIRKKLTGIETTISHLKILDYIISSGKGLYSAADVTGILEEACLQAINEMRETGSTKPIPITEAMIRRAIALNPPRTSPKELQMYEDFIKGVSYE